ncbi:hypothetical protein T492DRAFT_989360 [Pavlovales sp. CCMP2436]|nr:hypothetical protein T492DRAFT_989360 [Pavlovales sp. CCMP2436]
MYRQPEPPYINISGSAWFNRCCSVTGLVDSVSVCAPAPTPRLGRASAAAALPWRPLGAASFL